MLALLDAPWFGGETYVWPAAPARYLSDDAGELEMPAPTSILLDGHQYAIETREYRHSSRRTLRDSTAVAGEPSDSLFDTQGQWMRYRHSWHLGAGQTLDDLGDDNANPFRFLHARNLNVWQNGELTLRPIYQEIANPLSGGASGAVAAAGGFAFLSTADGTWYASPSTWTWNAVSGISAGALDAAAITTDTHDVYIADGNNLYRIVAVGTPGTATVFSAGACDSVAFVANRLLLGDGNELYEVGAGGARTLVKTHFQPYFRWSVMFAVGSRIYVGGTVYNRGELYSLSTDDAGALIVSAEAAPFEPTESLLSAVAYAGFVILGTSLGTRFAQIGADGTLTYGPPVAPLPIETSLTPVHPYGMPPTAITVGGGRAYASGGLVFNPVLAEMNLATFVDTLQPAHTIVGDFGDSPAHQAMSSLTFLEQPSRVLGYDAVNGITLLYGELLTDAEAAVGSEGDHRGYVQTGLIRFGTIEEKVLVDLEVGFEALPAGCSVSADVLAPNGTEIVGTGTQATTGATELLVDLENSVARAVMVRITLASDDADLTPTVRYWRMRAYPVAPPVQEWIVPIIAHETVTVGSNEGIQQAQDPLVIRNRIEALWADKTPTTYTEGDVEYTVRLEDFEIRPNKWTSDGKYFESLILVKLVAV